MATEIWSRLPAHLTTEITYKRMIASGSLEDVIAFMESDPFLITKALQDQAYRLQLVQLITRLSENNNHPGIFKKILNYPQLIDWKAEQPMELRSGFILGPFDLSKILLDQVFFSEQVISLILDKLLADRETILLNPRADVKKLLSRSLLRGCQSGASESVISFVKSPLLNILPEGIVKNGVMEAAKNDHVLIVQYFLQSSSLFDDSFVGNVLELASHPFSESEGIKVALYLLHDPIQRPRLSASAIFESTLISIRTSNHELTRTILNDADLIQRMGLTVMQTDELVSKILETAPVDAKSLMAIISNTHLLSVLSPESLGRIFEEISGQGGSWVSHLFLFRSALVGNIPLGSLEKGSLKGLETAQDTNQYLRALFYSQGRPLSRFSSSKLVKLLDYLIESENSQWISEFLHTPEWLHRISSADLGTVFLKAYQHLQAHPESTIFESFMDTQILDRIPKEGRILRIVQVLGSHDMVNTLSSIARMHIA